MTASFDKRSAPSLLQRALSVALVVRLAPIFAGVKDALSVGGSERCDPIGLGAVFCGRSSLVCLERVAASGDLLKEC